MQQTECAHPSIFLIPKRSQRKGDSKVEWQVKGISLVLYSIMRYEGLHYTGAYQGGYLHVFSIWEIADLWGLDCIYSRPLCTIPTTIWLPGYVGILGDYPMACIEILATVLHYTSRVRSYRILNCFGLRLTKLRTQEEIWR